MRKPLLLICLLSLIVAGCGQANSLPSVQALNPTSVEITRQKHGQFKALDVTITNVGTVRQLYSDLRTVGLFPSRSVSCPADFGLNYTLTFKSGDKVTLTADADPNGCQAIRLSTGQTLWGIDPKGKQFWALLAKSVGLPDESYLGGMVHP